MRLLLDTNVLIDLYTRRPPQGDVAQKLLIMEQFGDVELWASAKSFTDLFYVLSKTYSSERIHGAFRESFRWLSLCGIEPDDIKLATERQWDDFEDCLVALCAEKVKADYLLTRDARGFMKSAVPTLSPKEFFELIEGEYGIVYDTIDL